MARNLSAHFSTAVALGLNKITIVILYRIALRLGLVDKFMPLGIGYDKPIFKFQSSRLNLSYSGGDPSSVINLAENILTGETLYFSCKKIPSGFPPAWFSNPFNGGRFSDSSKHWSRLSDFSPSVGDIKTVWEASRFDWALALARAFILSKDQRFLNGLNVLSADWTTKNPLNTGPNWKCGQETGIRMLQVLLAGHLLQQCRAPAAGLVRFVDEHCRRIEPTIRYAMAQDNNHGTSEAAALFIGGAWLATVSPGERLKQKALRWNRKGRRWLENRADRLVAEDGSFSQHSLNYHRVLVDTLNMVEFWRRQLGQDLFSERFYQRARAAVLWLYQMTDPLTGDGPNLGANDGARLFNLASCDYRDYRPSIQLGGALFLEGKLLPAGDWDEPLFWLGLDTMDLPPLGIPRVSTELPQGGYAIFRPSALQDTQTWGLVRYPFYRFRPSHADGLHFDLWHKGVNILRDSGSYSYNCDEPWQSYFPSTNAHNTVEFNKKDQMPRLGRFLYGAWLRMKNHEPLVENAGSTQWAGEYRDYQGCSHKRTIQVGERSWRVIDEVAGFESAVLRWRLAPGNWSLKGQKLVGDLAELEVKCDRPIKRVELVEGWESRYYLQKTSLPVLEVAIDSGPAVLTTEIVMK